jgi:hypothetical protein
LRKPLHRDHGPPAILAHHDDDIGLKLGDGRLHHLDAGEECVRDNSRHDLGAVHFLAVETPGHSLRRIDGRGAERLETGQ